LAAFKYTALDAAGKEHGGLLEADSARAARAQLRERGLLPLEVDSVAAPRSGHSLLARGLPRAELVMFTQQLATLLDAGLPLERALTALADEAEHEAQRNLVAGLRAEVNAGSTFARALQQHPREFSDIYCAVIGAGEASGSLGPVLERLADDLESHQALQSKLIGAALYPAIVTLVAIVIVLFLVSYVVPQVASVFAGTKRALPWLTVAMLALSDFVRSYGWAALVALVLGAVGFRLSMKNPVLRERFDAWWLRLPLIGRLARGYNAARFAGTLALLAALFNQIDPAHYPPPLLHLLGGSAVMCAFFIATDPVGAPVTPLGRAIFGAGIGALIYVIRTWGGYPEGVAFAVLLMNAATPLIDRLVRPRRYGRLRTGNPIPLAPKEDGR